MKFSLICLQSTGVPDQALGRPVYEIAWTRQDESIQSPLIYLQHHDASMNCMNSMKHRTNQRQWCSKPQTAEARH